MLRLHLAAARASLAFPLLAGGASAQEPAPAPPMAGFARLIGGEWRMLRDGEAIQFDTWTWGPGRHSIRNLTHGSGSGGVPWRGLDVFYWHPGRAQIRLLGLHPDIPTIGRGVSEGSMEFTGEAATAAFDLLQSVSARRPRTLSARWAFEGPDRYRETLLEAPSEGAEYARLAEWQYVRSATLTPPAPLTDEASNEPSTRLGALRSLLGRTWKVEGDPRAGAAAGVELTLEWLPLVEVVLARVVRPTPGAEPTAVLDAYVYQHPTEDDLRCLALSAWGGVHEGKLSLQEHGTLRFELESHAGERVSQHVLELAPEHDAALRARVWNDPGDGTTLALDTRLRAREVK